MPHHAPATIIRWVDAGLLLSEDCVVTFAAQLCYDTRDPYAVTATFFPGDGLEVAWVLARDLLVGGLDHQIGDGDAVVRPLIRGCGTEVELELSIPGHHARVTFPAETLNSFLRASHDLVPLGTESDYLDLDALILQLLSNREEAARSDVDD
jgi:hypothetical protein